MIAIPSHLSDDELTAEVLRCARDEGRATARPVAHLAEFDARRLYLPAGCSSLFVYGCKVLGLSEHATCNRIEAARLARRFPEVLDRLSSGSLNLTALRLLAPHLTDANHEDLLRAGGHRGRARWRRCWRAGFPSRTRRHRCVRCLIVGFHRAPSRTNPRKQRSARSSRTA